MASASRRSDGSSKCTCPTSATNCGTPQHHPHPTPKAKKLKSTCDFCALSKVKCDRSQPQCMRCIRNDVECRYSETRRTGKARRLYATSVPSTNPSAHEDQGSQQSASIPSPDSPTSIFALNQEAMDLVNQTDFMSGPLPQEFSMPFLDAESSDLWRCISQLDGNFEGTQYNTPLSWELTSTTDEPMKNAPSSPSSSEMDGENCMKRALLALENLLAPVECSSVRPECNPQSQHPTLRSLDATLKNNRMAISAVRDILPCSCARTGCVSFLLTLTAYQVVDSYRTLAKQLSTHSSPAGVESRDVVASSHGAASFVFDVPMAIGGYVLNGEARTRVIMQVLRSEVEEMGDVIGSLASSISRGAGEDPIGDAQRSFIESLQTHHKEALQLMKHK